MAHFNTQLFTDRKQRWFDASQIRYNNDDVSIPVPRGLKWQNLVWLYRCYHDSQYITSHAAAWMCGI